MKIISKDKGAKNPGCATGRVRLEISGGKLTRVKLVGRKI